MSGERSDWRERLRANPSRMEQELAIKLEDNGIVSLIPATAPKPGNLAPFSSYFTKPPEESGQWQRLM